MKKLLLLSFLFCWVAGSVKGQKCISGDCKNGHGTCTYAIGDKYVGEWKDAKRNGQGTYTYAIGDKYVGEWKDDKRNGQGTFTWGLSEWAGDKYVGEWKDDKHHGKGTYTYAKGDKDRYVGEYKHGNQHGNGIMYFKNGGSENLVFVNGEKVKTIPSGYLVCGNIGYKWVYENWIEVPGRGDGKSSFFMRQKIKFVNGVTKDIYVRASIFPMYKIRYYATTVEEVKNTSNTSLCQTIQQLK